MVKPHVCIVSPALAAANNGNWHTVDRWRQFLSDIADIDIVQAWNGGPQDALIALHARRSAASIAAFAQVHPARPLAVVLTGTDIYRDTGVDASALHSIECATHLVVLQKEALHQLAPHDQAKARVIVQSAAPVERTSGNLEADFLAVGHLRAEKDPLTLMQAAKQLPEESPVRIVHLGDALDPALGEQARLTMAQCHRYRWMGAVSHEEARQWMARSRALVHMSLIEGGANAVIEAICTRLPVLASRVDGNVGLLGQDYEGYFEPGNSSGLAALMQRFAREPVFAARLASQCAKLEPGFAPAVEQDAVRALLKSMLQIQEGSNR